MGTKDRMYELTTIEEVDEFMNRFPTGAFFKAGACHKTMQGFGYVEQALNPYENIHVGFVRVIQSRPASNYIAEIMQVVHQSPQLILYINRKPVYDVDNWNITPEALKVALPRCLGSVSEKVSAVQTTKKHETTVDPYITLLEKLMKKELSEQEFRTQWLTTFQLDSALRSSEQFNLLNGLFGDVDAALSKSIFGTLDPSSQLRERASNLLDALKN